MLSTQNQNGLANDSTTRRRFRRLHVHRLEGEIDADKHHQILWNNVRVAANTRNVETVLQALIAVARHLPGTTFQQLDMYLHQTDVPVVLLADVVSEWDTNVWKCVCPRDMWKSASYVVVVVCCPRSEAHALYSKTPMDPEHDSWARTPLENAIYLEKCGALAPRTHTQYPGQLETLNDLISGRCQLEWR